MTVSRNTTTKKWSITKLLLEVDIGEGLEEKLNVFDGKLKFQAPTLTLMVLNPNDKPNRTWNINIQCYVPIPGALTEVNTNFFLPPPGLRFNPGEFSLELDFDTLGQGGAKVGELVVYFADQTLEATGIDPSAVLPAELRDAISSIEVSAASVSFTDVSTDPSTSTYKLRWLEAMIKAGLEPWKIVEDFELSDILVHFSHNTGAYRPTPGMQPPLRSTNISIGGNLKVCLHQCTIPEN